MIITNEWTEVAHGHARTELRLVKKFVNDKGLLVEILSTTSNFGDIILPFKDGTAQIPRILLRGPLYRQSLKHKYKKIAKYWEQALAGETKHMALVITSGFWPSLLYVLKFASSKKIYFRLISPPDLKEVKKRDVRLIKECIQSNRLNLGIETSDGLEFFKSHFGISALLVPPLTSINSDIQESGKVGVFWSVTDPATSEEIIKTLSKFTNIDLLVKLPVGFKSNQLHSVMSRIELIENGVSDEEFTELIRKIKYAYLPHKGYRLRGSGLVTSMLGSGAYVLAHEDNSFFQDFKFSKLMIPVKEAEIPTAIFDIEKHSLTKLDRRVAADHVNDFIKQKWSTFLDISNE